MSVQILEMPSLEELEALNSLKLFVEKHPYDLDDMLDLSNKQLPTPGNTDEFTRYIRDYKVVFTHDWQPFGICRHMSIFKQDKSEPNIFFIQICMELLGFECRFNNCFTYEEMGYAINILEPIDKEKYIKYVAEKKAKTQEDGSHSGI